MNTILILLINTLYKSILIYRILCIIYIIIYFLIDINISQVKYARIIKFITNPYLKHFIDQHIIPYKLALYLSLTILLQISDVIKSLILFF